MKRLSQLRVLLFGLILLSCAFLFLPSRVAQAQGFVSTATREGRLAVFDDVWETIRDRYYDPSFHGLDWEEMRARFRPVAAEASTPAEFYAALRRMIGGLRDTHTSIYAPDEKFDWPRVRVVTVGLSVREVEGLPTVVAVERNSEGERAGLAVGDHITTIDGEPALERLARRLGDASAGASTVQSMRLRAAASLFAGPAGSTVRVGWVGSDNRERFATLKREWRERVPQLNIEKERGGYAVVRFDAFTHAVALSFLRALDGRLKDARGIVLDLRANGGGEAEAMTDVASIFLPERTSLGRFMDRTGRARVEPQTRAAMLLAADLIRSFHGPLVILTSAQTASAAEIFVAALQETRRATVLGTNTCGCVLAIRRRHVLPDGGELDVSEMDYRTSRGLRLEGAGITPDETLPPTRADLRTGRDRARERALELLKEQRRG